MFSEQGAVFTDLDGTAVYEQGGKTFVADEVSHALKALNDLGRPVLLNTLRFPLNVIRTFGRAWSAITSAPLPLISLNGSIIGHLVPGETGAPTFHELDSFPIPSDHLEDAIRALDQLLHDGIDDIVVFHYGRDWTQGETVWTPKTDRVEPLTAKYRSASTVWTTSLERLFATWLSEHCVMLSILIDIPQDRRMAYQQVNPNRFITAPGVDKLFGAQKAAALFGIPLEHAVGAGDSPMDSFLRGVGLALHVGPMSIEHRGLQTTIRLRDQAELGVALQTLASFGRLAA